MSDSRSWIEQRVANDGKSPFIAFLYWLVIGLFGGHRFYLGYMFSASAMLTFAIFSIVVTFGAAANVNHPVVALIFLAPIVLWWLIDFLLIPGMLDRRRDELRQQLVEQQKLTPAA